MRGWLEWSAVALLLIFVAILVALSFFFGEMGYGVHISILGSLALTFIVSLAMNALSNRRLATEAARSESGHHPRRACSS